MSFNNKINIEKIKQSSTIFIGKEIEYYSKIDSTHLYAQAIANKEKNNGKIILAEIQQKAIGTKGRKWYTGERKQYSDDNNT